MSEIVKMEGFESVRLALIETPKQLRLKVVHAILRKAAQPILKAAKANAPVAKKATKRVIPGIKAIGEDNPSLKAGEIEVRTTRSVLPNHIWIGVNGVNGHVNA